MNFKKVFFLLLISILLIPCFVKAEEDESNNIKLDSITLLSKSENAEEVSSAKLDGKKISLDLKLYDPGDYVEYSIKIKNVSEKEYTFDKSTFKVEKEYLTYEFSYDEESNVLKPNEERVLKLKVLYTNKVPETKLVNDSFSSENSLIISLTNDDKIVPIINPETGLTNPIFYVSIMILSGTMILVIFKGSKKVKILVITLYALSIIPLYTYALTKIDIDVDAKVLIDGKEAYFLTGSEVNIKMKELAGNDTSSSGRSTTDYNILSIRESKSSPALTNRENKNIVSLDNSPYPIYMWFEDGTIYWWSEDKSPNLNSDGASMFALLDKLDIISGLENFDSSRLTTMYGFFNRAHSLTSLKSLSKWDVSKVSDMSGAFYESTSLENLAGLENWNTSSLEKLYNTFSDSKLSDITALKKWNTSNVTNMSCTFQSDANITSLSGLEDWDTSNVTDMHLMFSSSYDEENMTMHIESLKPLENWDVSKVVDMRGMFQSCTKITSLEGLEKWNLASAELLRAMFLRNYSLTNVDAIYNWSVPNLTNFVGVFFEDYNIKKIGFSDTWDFSKITSLSTTFQSNTELNEINMENMDLSSVTNTNKVFKSDSKLERIKTPKAYPTNVNVKIDLPATFCDEDGNRYTKLDNTSPTQVWLTKCE